MIDTKAIRSKILDLALRGLLTEQFPEDGTAEDLYQQIQAEKQELIKAGKIKKEKPLPPISEDEIPFEIPGNWKWVRLENVTTILGGYAFKSDNYAKDGFRVIRISDFNENGLCNSKIVRHPFTNELSKFLIKKNDILLCMTGGTVGKSYLLNHLDEPMLLNQRVALIRTIFVSPKFINYYILSSLIQGIIAWRKKSTNDNISMDDIIKFPLPLPPLAEQKRIVEKIEQTFSVLDTIDSLQTKYANNLSALKSKLIEFGLKGLLTERLDTDGTPEAIVSQARKKPVKMDAIPFDIPSSWIWTSIEEVSIAVGKKEDQIFSNEVKMTGKYPAISQGEQFIDGYTDEEKPIMDVPILIFGDHTKNVKYVDFPFVICADGTKCLKIPKANPKYVYYWMKYASSQIEDKGYARHYSLLKKYPLPLPPLAEQKRIVEKLEEVLAVCDSWLPKMGKGYVSVDEY